MKEKHLKEFELCRQTAKVENIQGKMSTGFVKKLF